MNDDFICNKGFSPDLLFKLPGDIWDTPAHNQNTKEDNILKGDYYIYIDVNTVVLQLLSAAPRRLLSSRGRSSEGILIFKG